MGMRRPGRCTTRAATQHTSCRLGCQGPAAQSCAACAARAVSAVGDRSAVSHQAGITFAQPSCPPCPAPPHRAARPHHGLPGGAAQGAVLHPHLQPRGRPPARCAGTLCSPARPAPRRRRLARGVGLPRRRRARRQAAPPGAALRPPRGGHGRISGRSAGAGSHGGFPGCARPPPALPGRSGRLDGRRPAAPLPLPPRAANAQVGCCRRWGASAGWRAGWLAAGWLEGGHASLRWLRLPHPRPSSAHPWPTCTIAAPLRRLQIMSGWRARPWTPSGFLCPLPGACAPFLSSPAG